MTSWIKSKFGIQRFSAIWHQLSLPKSHPTLHLSFPTCKPWFMWFSLNLQYPFFSPLSPPPQPVFKTWFKCRAFSTPTPCLLPLLCAPMERQRGQWCEISIPSPVLCCGHLHPFRSPVENIKRGKTRQRRIPCDCPWLWLWPRSWCALSKLGVILSSFVLNLRDSFCLRQWFSRLFQKPLISKRILQRSNI